MDINKTVIKRTQNKICLMYLFFYVVDRNITRKKKSMVVFNVDLLSLFTLISYIMSNKNKHFKFDLSRNNSIYLDIELNHLLLLYLQHCLTFFFLP